MGLHLIGLAVQPIPLRVMVSIVQAVPGEAKAIGPLRRQDLLVTLLVAALMTGVLLAVQAVLGRGVVIHSRRFQQVGAIGSVPAFRVFQLN